MNDKLTVTYRTRFKPSHDEDLLLSNFAKIHSKVLHTLFAKQAAGIPPDKLKSPFIKKFGITARQFNAARVQLQGIINSQNQLQNQRIQSLKAKIEEQEKKIKTLKNKPKHKRAIFQKRRRLQRLNHKHQKLMEDQKQRNIRLCFGTKKLFHKQFEEEANHEEWKKEWLAHREQEFFILGSKDETGGNQTCTPTIEDDGTISLRLRLPNQLGPEKYLNIKNLTFSYGHENLILAIQNSLLRTELQKNKDPSYKNFGTAICFRFKKDSKGWELFATFTLRAPKWISDQALGVLGLDINTDHLALTETDRFGNPISSHTLPFNLTGKTTHQSKAIIGDICKQAIQLAKTVKKPLILENLNFSKKKEALKNDTKKYARMLSSFAYSSFIQNLQSKAFREKIQVFQVNPAFTSLIGTLKFTKRYGLSNHQAAALIIARRFLKCSEKLPKSTSINCKGEFLPFSVPVRKQTSSKIFYLLEVKRTLKAAIARHFRTTKSRSLIHHLVDLVTNTLRNLLVKPQHANRQQNCLVDVSILLNE